MIKYILVRHMESEGNVRKAFNGVSESPLTERGRVMKEKCVDTLTAMHDRTPFDLILTSPIERARCIGEAVAERTGVECQINDALKEFNFGIFEGLTAKEAEEKAPEIWQQWMADYDGYTLPQGDSGDEYHRRMTLFLQEKEKEIEDKTVAVIAHGGTIHSILMHYLGLPLRDKWHFNIPLGSIVTLRVFDGFGILDGLMVPEYD